MEKDNKTININKKGQDTSDKIHKKKMNKVLKVFLIILLILFLFVGIAFTSGYVYLNNKIGKMNKETIDTGAVGITDTTAQELKTYTNIALLGIDSRADDYDLGNRSDCIMIASINNKTKDIKLISVYRDTYVNVLENGQERLDKITHAYSYGGAQNTLKSLNEALDLNVTQYMTVNFEAVKEIVNSVGGIDITITSEEVPHVPNISSAGTYTLNGEQALAYSRIRYATGGDYKRTERMRTVLTKIIGKMKEKNISELNRLTDELLPKVSTNITSSEIISLIPDIARYNISDSIGWPYETRGITLDRWYGVPCTLESNVVKLHKEVFEQSDYEAPDDVKTMSNAIIKKTGYKN